MIEVSIEQWEEFYGQVWDILRDNVDASKNPYDRMNFIHHMLADKYPCTEWRFCGSLGFGGKIYRNDRKLYVSCYPEDETRARRKLIKSVNKKLEKLQKKMIGGPVYGSPTNHKKIATFWNEQQ